MEVALGMGLGFCAGLIVVVAAVFVLRGLQGTPVEAVGQHEDREQLEAVTRMTIDALERLNAIETWVSKSNKIPNKPQSTPKKTAPRSTQKAQ